MRGAYLTLNNSVCYIIKYFLKNLNNQFSIKLDFKRFKTKQNLFIIKHKREEVLNCKKRKQYKQIKL